MKKYLAFIWALLVGSMLIASIGIRNKITEKEIHEVVKPYHYGFSAKHIIESKSHKFLNALKGGKINVARSCSQEELDTRKYGEMINSKYDYFFDIEEVLSKNDTAFVRIRATKRKKQGIYKGVTASEIWSMHLVRSENVWRIENLLTFENAMSTSKKESILEQKGEQ